jgi:two-component system response regulator AtoC
MKILVADDEHNLRKVLLTELAEEGYKVSGADNGVKAFECLEREEFDVVILDLNMPGLGGIDVLRKLRSFEVPPEVIILTGNATIPTAVEAMKLGAYDYLAKPCTLDELKTLVEKAYEKRKLLGENIALKTQIQRQSSHQRTVTESPLMKELLDNVRKMALSDLPVLIYGESGVGKELIAWRLHEASRRAGGPFIPVNCGAIPENTMESELFGHEKGSFTGAYARKPGLLEIAGKGTLFLDEIGEMPLRLQVKLLRVIDTRSFFRVGGVKEVTVETKFLFATNKDLRAEVGEGRFRHDLYYRLSALTLYVPPLRERKDDIPLLVRHFTDSMPDFRHKTFSREALGVLTGYSWPGNVRELQNVVQRCLLLSRHDIVAAEDLPPDLAEDTAQAGTRLEDVERNHILKVLREVGGQRGKAARILGIDPKTLYRKLAGYGLEA